MDADEEKMRDPHPVLYIRVPFETKQRLNGLARRLNCSLNWAARLALIAGIPIVEETENKVL